MQVKVFESPDMATGLKMVRKELGPDALILSTRTIRSSKLGRLGKQVLEITAAVDNQWPDKKNKKNPRTNLHGHSVYRDISNSRSAINTSRSISDETSNEQSVQPAPLTSDESNIRNEMDELKSMVKNLAGELNRIQSTKGSAPNHSSEKISSLLNGKRISSEKCPIESMLVSHGINSENASTLAKFTKENLTDSDLANSDKVYEFLRTTIEDIITVNPPQFGSNGEQRRIALLGPTGVGKTTSLAKIAARYLASVSSSIALITIDTYRIAAVEQLKVYGEIMHLPVEVVINPAQLEKALIRHQDKDLILIDTAGRSPRDTLSIEEISTFFKEQFSIENHLVLSAATRDNELLQIISQFQQIPIHSTIYTKIDECVNLGVLLNVQIHNGSPVSYVTNGQRVPEDIAEADKQQLAELILPFSAGS